MEETKIHPDADKQDDLFQYFMSYENFDAYIKNSPSSNHITGIMIIFLLQNNNFSKKKSLSNKAESDFLYMHFLFVLLVQNNSLHH